MRKYLFDHASRTIHVFDQALPLLYPAEAEHPPPPRPLTGVPPHHTLAGRASFDWGPGSQLVGRFEAAQALLVDTLTYYEVERNVTDETLTSGASLAPLFARPYADHVLGLLASPQMVLTAEDVLAWLLDQCLQGLEHVERRTAQAVLTYLCNLLLHKEVVHARLIHAAVGGGSDAHAPD